jgi:hypothetical protein
MVFILSNILRMPRREDHNGQDEIAPSTIHATISTVTLDTDTRASQHLTGPLLEIEEVDTLAGLSTFIRDALAASDYTYRR